MTESTTVTVTDSTFAQEVLENSQPVLVDFWASWCGPCRMVAPVLEEIAKEQEGKLVVAKLDVDANPKISTQYDINSIPNLILFQNGEPVKQIVGAKPKAAILRELGL